MSPRKTQRSWSSAEKFAAALETARMNEAERAEYARRKGLYVEQITAWTLACRDANGGLVERPEGRADKKRIHERERELNQKEKALAGSRHGWSSEKKPKRSGGRGRMISLSDRQHAVTLIDEAIGNGARRMPAAQILGLKSADLQHTRGRARAPVRRRRPTSHCATGPNQVWCWDITWLPAALKGTYHYWYMVLDIYSRKIVAHEVHAAESAEHAGDLLRRASLAEGLSGRPLVLHSDNG